MVCVGPPLAAAAVLLLTAQSCPVHTQQAQQARAGKLRSTLPTHSVSVLGVCGCMSACPAGLLAAMLHKDQDLRDAALRLQAQLQLLHSHAAQLQLVADKAVRTAVRGTAGLRDDPIKHQQQQQKQGTLGGGFASNAVAGLRSASQHVQAAKPDAALTLLSSQVPGVAAAGVHVQRAGSGGSISPFAGAASGGGRAHLARQSQDEGALRQMFGEQQALAQEWQQLQQLVGYQGPWDAFVQLAQQAGRSGVVAALQRHTALPWHLGQQPEQGHELRSLIDRQGQARSRQQAAGLEAQASGAGDDADARVASTLSDSQPGSRTAARSFAAAAGAGAGAAAGAAVNTAPPDQIAVVARPKQKQAEGIKRKAPAGGSLLKRRR